MVSPARPRHGKPKRRMRSDAEVTRLPYLIDAALRLRGSLQHAEPGAWTPAANAEERQEGEQQSSEQPIAAIRDKKQNAIKRGRKRIPRLLPGEKAGLKYHYKDGADAKDDSIPVLSALDERVLILYHSSLKRAWKQQQPEISVPTSSLAHYGHEAIYAATQIQKIFRGVAARNEWRAFYCLRNQCAASRIQFAFRRAIVSRKVLARLAMKRNNRAAQIQVWYRGHRRRDRLWYQHIRVINQRIANFQRYIRGRRLWRIVTAILYKRRCDVATKIQRCYRGWKGRQRAVAVRFEQNRHVRELLRQNEIHTLRSRCEGCALESCTEDSLFACFMVRYVGLHDFRGARALSEDGLWRFPSSAKFHFFYSVLLQAMCEDSEISMEFLKRAKELGITTDEITQCETRFFQPAYLLRPTDAQAFLDLAILCQNHDQLSRAEASYLKALAQLPQEYAIPGYLHRVHMVDRLLLNYHRFCSIFNFRQVNVLLKEVSTSKKGKKIRLMVSKLNHYTTITPMDDPKVCRINTLYLTDDEVLSITAQLENDGESGNSGTTNKSHKTLASWGSSNMNSSTRQKSFRSMPKEVPERSTRLLSQKATITQLYQQEFTGLNVRPSDLAQFSETRSKLRLTKPTAGILLNAIVFVDPTASHTEEPTQWDETQQSGPPTVMLQKVMLIPSIFKTRQQHRSAIVRSRAAIDAQRVYRGFRLRTVVRREKLLNDIRQQQADEMHRRLHDNYLLRELRRTSAEAIQRIYKGYAFRQLLRRWQVQAGVIQRIFRGYRGRLRATAFREGTCTFYMAERVFQRGVNVSGHRVMLIVEKCGLSFRLDGYDLELCVTYHGFFSHSSSMALLCYLNWTYGETLCGREFTRKGEKLTIREVSSVSRLTGECFVDCEGAMTTTFTIPLTDCVQAINLRNFSAGDNGSPILPMPMTVEDTVRLVDAIAERVTLVPTLRMATAELKAKGSADFTISVRPPPKMHFAVRRKPISGDKQPLSCAPSMSALQFVFPVMNGLRGMSVGTKNFRKKCTLHSVQFTRCRCILPIVSTSAHIEAISLALTPPPPPSLPQQLN